MIGTEIKGAVVLASLESGYGVTIGTVKLDGFQYEAWAAFRKLPKVIDVNGMLLGKSAFNSDSMVAYYRSDYVIGLAR